MPVLYDTAFAPEMEVQPPMPSALSCHWIVQLNAPPDTEAVSVVPVNLQICVPPLMLIDGSANTLINIGLEIAWSQPTPVHVRTTLT